MKQISAGILLYRRKKDTTEFFLVHPGGPFWAKKDNGAWTIPKGLAAQGEDLLAAARREFSEETGFAPEGDFRFLGEFKQPSGKIIHVWAVEGDCDPAQLKSNFFPLEWPPKSGKIQQFPEIDRAAWLSETQARMKILRGQLPILDAFSAAPGSPPAALRAGMKTKAPDHTRSSTRHRARAAGQKTAKPAKRPPKRG
jgi:predicted NUDIX family NTP pyrophosphohydrolase